MTDKIRIGIIGSGGIARAHANAYAKMKDVEVCGVADIIPGRAEEFIAAMGLQGTQAFTDHRDLLKLDLDGVSICTPNIAHHQTSVDALNAGKHVLTEKPMAVTLDQAIDMVLTARKAGKILSVGFQPRYDPNQQEIRRIVQSGVLGKVYHVQTGGGRRRGIPGKGFIRKDISGSGALADIGCYSLDLAMNALGYPLPLTVSAYSSSYFGTNPEYYEDADRFDVEDFGEALIRFAGDVVLNFKISWAMHMDSLGPTLFLGTDGGLKVEPTINVKNPLRTGVWDKGVSSITLFHDVLGHPTRTPLRIIEHNKDIFYEKVRDYVVAIKEGKPAPIPGEQILLNQAVIDGILRSAALKREVEIHIPEECLQR
jgi:predicted dehydrogenase